MHAKVILSILFMLSVSGGVLAQGVTLSTMPRKQTQVGDRTVYTITPSVTGNFKATIFLRASSPTLTGHTFTFDPAFFNYPYQISSELRVQAVGAKTSGEHLIIIEGYNGPLVVRDTCVLSIAEMPAWRVFNKSNSPLPHDSIGCIAIDRNGVGWIGTREGLASFDGTTWNVFTTENSGLPSNLIYSIAIDSTNAVWLGTQGGLTELRAGVWQTHIPANPTFDTVFYKIAADRTGAVWMIDSPNAYRPNAPFLTKFDGTTWTAFTAQNSQAVVNYAEKIAIDEDDAVWIMNFNFGLDMFDGTYWTHFDADDVGYGDYTNPQLWDIVTDPDGDLWLATHMGIVKFDGVQKTVYPDLNGDLPFVGAFAHLLCIDLSGTIWMPNQANGQSKYSGLGRYDGSQFWHYTIGNSGLTSNSIFDIKADQNNTIWIGTDKGLVLLDGNAAPLIAFTSVEEADARPPSPLITSVAPNPSSDVAYVTLNVQKAMHVRLTLHDQLGRQFMTLCDGILDAGERSMSVDTRDFPTGLYVLYLATDDVVESRVLIINR